MGQYYKPINLDTNENLYSHDYDNGLKLMEHSYLTNNFVGAVENLLMPDHKWHKARIVWAGDYADSEVDEKGNPLIEKWMDDNGREHENDVTLYNISNDENTIKPRTTNVPKEFKYIVNHTKKEYVNKDSVPKMTESWADGMKVHPLPLLTCEGNGRGGGDYHGKSSLIGSWARDVISIEKECPRGYKKLKFDLVEG